MAALLAAAPQAAAPTALDAELAFMRRAQAARQWQAFREFADKDAVMFVPQPVQAREWLSHQEEPATSVVWWAADSYASCDGGHAVNTGPWIIAPIKLNGVFTTVWRRGDAGWKWIYDGGQPVAEPRPAGDRPRTHRASCKGAPTTVPAVRYREGETGEGQSEDRTLAWRWHVAADGTRTFDAWLWNGKAMVPVVQDRVAAAR